MPIIIIIIITITTMECGILNKKEIMGESILQHMVGFMSVECLWVFTLYLFFFIITQHIRFDTLSFLRWTAPEEWWCTPSLLTHITNYSPPPTQCLHPTNTTNPCTNTPTRWVGILPRTSWIRAPIKRRVQAKTRLASSSHTRAKYRISVSWESKFPCTNPQTSDPPYGG